MHLSIQDLPPRRARHYAAGPTVIGSNDILTAAQMAAGACAPSYVRDRLPSCGPGAPPGCNQYPVRSQSSTTAGNATSGTITYSFQRPFQLKKLSITGAAASGVTISSLKIAGVEQFPDGPSGGGIYSDTNQESGGPVGDGSWVMPGQNIALTYAQAAAATTYAISGPGA